MALFLVLAVDGFAAPTDDLREFIHSDKERLGIPGVSVALIDEGVVQYITLGVRRAGEADDVSSVDAFGSIAKTITAWAVMRLAEQGLVSLDAPVQQHIGQRWQLPEPKFDNASVTLRRILSHTAGLSAPSYQAVPWGSAPISLEDSLNGIPVRSSVVRVVMEPGSEYRYSGGGYSIAQLVVESVTGQSFSEFVTNELFAPLGMEHAQYLTIEQEPLPVSPHDYAGRPITDYRLIEQAAGGLSAGAQDLVNFIMANMAPNAVLSERTVTEMHEPVESIGGEARPTLGFERRGSLLSHGGHNRGWMAQIDFQPSSKSGLVILTNSANGLHFVQPIRCRWGELFDIDDLMAFCEQQMLKQGVTDWTLGALSGVSLILAIWIALHAYLNLRSRAAQVSFGAARIVRGLLYVVSIGGIWAVLGTGLGVYLVSGVRWGLPTIGYFSTATQYAVMALTVLLGVLACTSFVTRKSS